MSLLLEILLLLVACCCACHGAQQAEAPTVAAAAALLPPPSSIDPARLDDRLERMEVLDAEARIFMIKGFLSHEEADHIIQVAAPRLKRSTVLAEDGSSQVDSYRTSSGMFLERGEDEVVARIEQRIADWTLLPVGNGEGLQVLRYEKTQHYGAHWDYLDEVDGVSNGGNRVATVLMYLADVEEGGETVFPNIPAPGGENEGFSDCAKQYLGAKPAKGDALLFHSIQPSGALERKSLHTACPVIKGVKWSAAKWIHVGHFSVGKDGDSEPVRIAQTVNEVRKQHDGTCQDLDDACPDWVKSGECTRNAAYMVGDSAHPGACLESCGRCDLLRPAKKGKHS